MTRAQNTEDVYGENSGDTSEIHKDKQKPRTKTPRSFRVAAAKIVTIPNLQDSNCKDSRLQK